jgi:hypothetical protein
MRRVITNTTQVKEHAPHRVLWQRAQPLVSLCCMGSMADWTVHVCTQRASLCYRSYTNDSCCAQRGHRFYMEADQWQLLRTERASLLCRSCTKAVMVHYGECRAAVAELQRVGEIIGLVARLSIVKTQDVCMFYRFVHPWASSTRLLLDICILELLFRCSQRLVVVDGNPPL